MTAKAPLPISTGQADAHTSERQNVAHSTVYLVADRRTAHIAVAPGFYALDIEDQRAAWDHAHDQAFTAGWVPTGDESASDLYVVDEDGTERYPLAPLCRLMGGECAPECRS